MAELEEETSQNERLSLWIAFDYGGRDELVQAARRLVESGIDPHEIDENAFAAQLYAPALPDPDLLIRTSGELRISNFLLWQLAYSELVFVDTLWPDFGLAAAARGPGRLRAPQAAVRRTVTNLASRLLVGAVGLPLVLGMVWLGGWWLFVLAAVVGLLALHEYYAMTRPLRPIVIAGYLGLILTLLAAQIGGFPWIAGGLATTFVLAFVLKGVADTRQSATVAVGGTVLGRGLDRARADLHPVPPRHARARTAGVPSRCSCRSGPATRRRSSSGSLVGRHKLAPRISPGKTWEGFVAGTSATIFVAFVALYDARHDFLSIGQSLLLGLAIAVAAPLGDLFESLLKRDMGVKDTGHLLGGHGGVLDRIDAPLFASIAAFYVVLALDKV